MKILTAFDLKILALLTMIIDHFGLMFYPDMFSFRIIGRVALVLYAFLLVEGFYHTKNFRKYISKVFIWAIISEVPYDLAMSGKFFNWQDQNIFFSLLFGLAGIYLMKFYNKMIIKMLVMLFFLSAAVILHVDYSWYGIALIFAFYNFRDNVQVKLIAIEAISMMASFKILIIQFFAFLGFIPILMYSGKKGKRIGDIYYSFYALHLLLFSIIKYA